MKKPTLFVSSIALGLVAMAVLLVLLPLVLTYKPPPTPTPLPPPTRTPAPPSPTPAIISRPVTSPTFRPIATRTTARLPATARNVTVIARPTSNCLPLRPVANEPSIWEARFSPDNRWLSYWSEPKEKVSQANDSIPVGVLHLINLQSGQACQRPELTAQFSGPVPVLSWPVNGDGQLTVTTDASTYQGLPCQAEPFAQTSPQTIADLAAASGILPDDYSPDGSYQVKTRPLELEFQYEIAIIAVESGQVVQRVTWLNDGTGYGEGFTGGEWVSNSQFLIPWALDTGPLIVDAHQGVIQVLTDLLGMQEIPSPENAEIYQPYALALPGDEPDQFHLLVVTAGQDGDSSLVHLYHAENGTAELLPYPLPWGGGFSPDGQWLMLAKHPAAGVFGRYEVWIRPVEEVGGAWQLLADPAIVEDWGIWNASCTEMIVSRNDRLTLLPFPNPEGKPIGCWQAVSFWIMPVAFSPDGCLASAIGFDATGNANLYVLDRCQVLPAAPQITKTREFSSLAVAQAGARFALPRLSFIPQGLALDTVSITDYSDGSQTAEIVYAEDFTGTRPSINRKLLLVRLTFGGPPVTLTALTSVYQETARDIISVIVRGQAGFSYWMPSESTGNSAWLSWNEGDLTISLALYGNWPQPNERNPHRLDELLLEMAGSLK